MSTEDVSVATNALEQTKLSDDTAENVATVNGTADGEHDEYDALEAFSDGDSFSCLSCGEEYKQPRVLNCLHVFCESCLKPLLSEDNITCPTCAMNTEVDSLSELPLHYVIVNKLDMKGIEGDNMSCTSCKAKEKAISRCSDCANFLCPNCVTAHQFMRCFENHKVVSFEDITKGDGMPIHRPISCNLHSEEQLMKYFCNTCQILICNECMLSDHQGHDIERCNAIQQREVNYMRGVVDSAQQKIDSCTESSSKLFNSLSELESQRDDAKSLINETFQSYKAFLEQRQQRMLDQLDVIHKQQELAVMEKTNEVNKTSDQIERGREFVQKIIDNSDCLEFLSMKKVMNQYMTGLLNKSLGAALSVDIHFVTDKDAFEAAVTDHFGHFNLRDETVTKSQQQQQQLHETREAERRHCRANIASEVTYNTSPPPFVSSVSHSDMQHLLPSTQMLGRGAMMSEPLPSRPIASDHLLTCLGTAEPSGYVDQFGLRNFASDFSNGTSGGLIGDQGSSLPGHSKPQSPTIGSDSGIGIESSTSPGTPAVTASQQSAYSMTDRFGRPSISSNSLVFSDPTALASLGPSADPDLHGDILSPSTLPPPVSRHSSTTPNVMDAIAQRRDSNNGFVSPTNVGQHYQAQFPLRGKMSAMQIRYKFGSLGPSKGQFNSPHGFCMGFEEDIVVADTNNHRIQVFDKSGEFRYQFGIPGREEGQLWYPRKVAVMRGAARYVICDRGNERSRMQIFSKNGHFVKKIAIRYIDIVAGLAITPAGNIVAVDSVSPTVFTISEGGDLIKWFDCSDYMREPSDIAVAEKEYYVCDFKGHCVVVFNDDGQFLRRIGTDTITNFPNGIDISDAGDVLVGDSHGNRFHVAVFQRDGSLIGEFECPYVKVSRCCGLKITSEGYVVTLAKNNHHVLVLNTLYIS